MSSNICWRKNSEFPLATATSCSADALGGKNSKVHTECILQRYVRPLACRRVWCLQRSAVTLSLSQGLYRNRIPVFETSHFLLLLHFVVSPLPPLRENAPFYNQVTFVDVKTASGLRLSPSGSRLSPSGSRLSSSGLRLSPSGLTRRSIFPLPKKKMEIVELFFFWEIFLTKCLKRVKLFQ